MTATTGLVLLHAWLMVLAIYNTRDSGRTHQDAPTLISNVRLIDRRVAALAILNRRGFKRLRRQNAWRGEKRPLVP